MKLSEVKDYLTQRDTLLFTLPDGTRVPAHFHVTEVGEVSKTFIDCGGTLRRERVANFQLWNADDYDHRLHPGKLVDIITLAEDRLGLADLEIEVEYQGPDTIGKYGLAVDADGLALTSRQTDCLARETCDISQPATSLTNLIAPGSSCAPGSGCC
ncbi:hypothetical protein LEM8419_00143 [Neolewinella maritima]|uniref:Uncharacterized protein n=1 Tax=Neolewinella maritima TaxID=1383882 RepID=A0ABN8F2A6_9BACT|nr:DUF6428 family protein [Neolewinella maritima]CAH0998826.1 hypothetical protein LEM8419_00143 [Neolewinella maritima]